MGHIRNQSPPNTVRWGRVVSALTGGSGVAVVAENAMSAAERGLKLAKGDLGLGRAVWLMAHLVIAARQPSFERNVSENLLSQGSTQSSIDLAAGFADAMDRFLTQRTARTDIGEMARLAGTETLARFVADRSPSLIGDGPDAVQHALKSLSSAKEFSVLAHAFFARFTERYLGYHLSRELSDHVGSGERFADPTAHTEFLQQLGSHCDQVALIVREFARGWYSKSKFETGISEESAQGFAAYSLTKIRDELHRRGVDGGHEV